MPQIMFGSKHVGPLFNSFQCEPCPSNPPGSSPTWHGTPGDYSAEFESNVAGTVEHFDVYGEVQTMYSQVYWTRNAPIALPPEIVERFRGQVMAITGEASCSALKSEQKRLEFWN